ncbi:RNA-binding protein [Ereboglobus sp. PH5-10]|uniref:YhbY family RNA-binding protein n=1 Tax=Ereboglobus sp. PH5-10 TaxID=2940629 RepID=UPI002404ABF1|nr:YhbY family RNA-binding protein [Ereboglobus sp. PH5-10]MDF9827529.1 RNA-binding protein [Ereboglobus sp. PH5-10]
MYDFPLTGAQRKKLRGIGQTLEPVLKLGKSGITREFLLELQRALNAHELIKVRLLEKDRDVRAELCERIADEGRCVCVGAVGGTALFFRRQEARDKQRVEI